MPDYVFGDLHVYLPYEAYELQKKYMAKVVSCLSNNVHGVLESPTGTGKTLALLCSSMAWLEYMKSKPINERFNYPPGASNKSRPTLNPEQNGRIKIIYASRTYAQLSKAMLELKNTVYGHRTDHAIILGTHEQLCIHSEISKKEFDGTKTTLCRELVKANGCSFYKGVESAKHHANVMALPILDIEDLVTAGKRLNACPYYLSTGLIESADIVFLPYGALLDPKARKKYGLNLQNSVIIMEEAHNLNRTCEEICSAQLRSSDIALAIEDVTFVIKTMKDPGEMVTKDRDTLCRLDMLKILLLNVKKVVDGIPVKPTQDDNTYSGPYIFELLKKANITFDNISKVLRLFNSIITFVTTEKSKRFVRCIAGLQSTVDFLEVVYAGRGEDYRQSIAQCYRVFIEYEKLRRNNKPILTTTSTIINFWCFSPGHAMRQLVDSGVRSIILTSGTLAPLQPFISELCLPVPIRLESPHITNANQLYVRVISHGPDRNELNSCYQNRSKPECIASLGCTMLSLSPIIPGGLLICFPSFSMLELCCEAWQKSSIWKQINDVKQIFVEPRETDQLERILSRYYRKVGDPSCRGGILLAVCHGRALEELDFTDANVRVIMITGIPYPPLLDPRVGLKKQYLNANRTRENQLITGENWYMLQAFRAINQAVGRILSHRKDYGAILLCDSRFQDTRKQSQLTPCVRNRLQEICNVANFGTVVGELSRFFRTMAIRNTPTGMPEAGGGGGGGGATNDKDRDARKRAMAKRRMQDSMEHILSLYVPDFRIRNSLPSSDSIICVQAESSGFSNAHKRERLIASNVTSTATSHVEAKKQKTVFETLSQLQSFMDKEFTDEEEE